MGIIKADTLEKIIQFREDRDWKQFHTPPNLAKSITIEAAELLENFQWTEDFDKQNILDELADVMIYCIFMIDTLGIDIDAAIKDKLRKNNEKYPVVKSKGNSKKYT